MCKEHTLPTLPKKKKSGGNKTNTGKSNGGSKENALEPQPRNKNGTKFGPKEPTYKKSTTRECIKVGLVLDVKRHTRKLAIKTKKIA